MYRPFRLLALLTPLAFALPACGGDDGGSASETDPTATTEDTQTPGTTETGTDTDNPTGNETETTEGPTTDDPTTDGPTTEDPTEEPTTEDPTEEPTTEDPTEEPTTDTGIDANCGNGEIEGDEACDDGNNVTEISESMATPMTYADGACIDDCSLVLGHCGDGVVDPGEACDDGNLDPYDDCTPSCTENDGSFSSPCFRDCGGDDCSSTNIQDGEIVGCGNVQAPPNAEKVCLESANDEVLMNEIHLFFAEGKCAVMAQKCDGFVCPGDLTIGDYDSFTDCPPGTEMVDRVTDSGLVTVYTKVCHKVCESDAECRWNAFDDVWVKSGENRCQALPETAPTKICVDAQN